MFPDAKWLDALKLPARVKAAVAAVCGLLYYLFKIGTLSFGGFDPLVTTLLLIGAVVFGVLVVFDAAAWLAQPLTEKRRGSALAARRAARRKEKEEERKEQRAAVLARLDSLSRQEVFYVAKALEDNSPTFYTYVYSPPVTMLQGKGLVWTPGGPHNQDHYPFSFHDFVWAELQKRREEFVAKEQAFKAAEEAAEKAKRRW